MPNEQSQWYTVPDDIEEEAPSVHDKDQESEGKEKKKVIRTVEDGLLMVVSARIYGRTIRTLIDSGATRCFVSPSLCKINMGDKILSRGYPINCRFEKLSTIKTPGSELVRVNPIVDWCGAKLYEETALLKGRGEGWDKGFGSTGINILCSERTKIDSRLSGSEWAHAMICKNQIVTLHVIKKEELVNYM